MPHWYVFDEGSEKGPLSDPGLCEYIKAKGDPTRLFVWREGLDNWILASDLPEILRVNRRPPPIVALREPEPSVASEGTEPPAKKCKGRWAKKGALIGLVLSLLSLVFGRGNANLNSSELDPAYLVGYIGGPFVLGAIVGFVCGLLADLFNRQPITADRKEHKQRKTTPRYNLIARHWRGELPLWVSYWVFGFLGNLLGILVPLLVAAAFKIDRGYYPPAIFGTIAATWATVLAISTWQLVGIWRSARFYAAARVAINKGTGWAVLAGLAVIIGFLGLISSFVREGLPQITEAYRIAFQDDPDIPAYSIRVMRDGIEAEIVGGLKYGVADDFAKIIKASRQIRTVHLDSIGGRVGEGEKLFNLFRERKLNTYVSSKCLSACTLAFAGGQERYLLKGASLGFHKGAFPGLDEDGDLLQKAIFRTAGFDAAFIDTALSTPNTDMWKPPLAVLIAANVVTNVTDGSRFAISGLGADIDKQKLTSELAAVPVFGAISSRFPERYETIINEYYDDLMRGRTQDETIAQIRANLVPFVVSLLPMADDDVLVDYNHIMVDQYIQLGSKDPTKCYLYATRSSTEVSFADEFSKELVERELSVEERVVRTAAQRAQADKEMLKGLWAKVVKKLLADGVTQSDLDMIDSANVEPPQHRRYCTLAIMLFREIGRLPRRESAMLMRETFADK